MYTCIMVYLFFYSRFKNLPVEKKKKLVYIFFCSRPDLFSRHEKRHNNYNNHNNNALMILLRIECAREVRLCVRCFFAGNVKRKKKMIKNRKSLIPFTPQFILVKCTNEIIITFRRRRESIIL